MKKLATLIAILALSAIALLPVACSKPQIQQQADITIIDDGGTSHSFDGPVDSIVSLSPSVTEIVYAVGAGDKLIGRTDYCNFPAAATDVASIGSFRSPDKESIVVKDPDVVLAGNKHEENGDIDWLTQQGLTVILLDPTDFEGIMANITLVGKISGNETQAAEVIDTMQEDIAYVTDRLVSLTQEQKTKVLHVTWDNPLWTVGQNNFAHQVIEAAGGANIFDDLEGDVQASIETAVVRDPQVIVTITGHGSGYYTPYDNVTAPDSAYKDTYAYKNSRVHMLNANLIARAGPRITEGLLLYARFLHPEIFV
ncbi:ABC transporter substrate-binding protein [Chloroflexota bacterium]